MPTGPSTDPASPLLAQAGIIRDQLAIIGPAMRPYLVEDDVRPMIGDAVLRLVLAADALLELVSPRADATAPMAAAAGFTPEQVAAVLGVGAKGQARNAYRGRGTREGWDFYPWLHEKATVLKESAMLFAAAWLRDPRSVRVIPEAPVSPKQYLRDELLLELGELQNKATAIFDLLFRDHIAVTGTAPDTAAQGAEAADPDGDGEPDDRAADDEDDNDPRLPWPVIPSLRPFAEDPTVLVKIGLATSPWTADPAAWRAATFEDTLPRMQGALDGTGAPLRVLNVQDTHGADVVLAPGRAEALLWHRWRPVRHELGDRGRFPLPVLAQVEAQVSAWAAERSEFLRLARHGRLVLAVVLRISVDDSSLDGLMRRLVAADAELAALVEAARRDYELALEDILLDVPSPEPRQILLVDLTAEDGADDQGAAGGEDGTADGDAER